MLGTVPNSYTSWFISHNSLSFFIPILQIRNRCTEGNETQKRYVAGKTMEKIMFISPLLIIYLPVLHWCVTCVTQIYPVLINCPNWRIFSHWTQSKQRKEPCIGRYCLGPREQTPASPTESASVTFFMTSILQSRHMWRNNTPSWHGGALSCWTGHPDWGSTLGKWVITGCQTVYAFPGRMEVGTYFPRFLSACSGYDNNSVSHLYSAFSL